MNDRIKKIKMNLYINISIVYKNFYLYPNYHFYEDKKIWILKTILNPILS